MRRDVTAFVKRCDKCQRNKHSTIPKEPLTITTTAKTVFEKLFLDVVGPIEKDDQGYQYILTLQCELSKYIEAYPLKSKDTVKVATTFVNNFVLRYGVPSEIATDKGTEFYSLSSSKYWRTSKYSHTSISIFKKCN